MRDTSNLEDSIAGKRTTMMEVHYHKLFRERTELERYS